MHCKAFEKLDSAFKKLFGKYSTANDVWLPSCFHWFSQACFASLGVLFLPEPVQYSLG